MENLVPLGTGNSRFMKSNISPSTTLAQLIQMLNNGTFPYDVGTINPAGISQQGTPLNKATLLKDATAALYGLGTGAVPNDLFNILSASALYKTVTPTAQLGTLAEGSIIYLNENGSPVPFYVAKQGYEPSYNTDRVLIVRKDAVQNGAWNSSGVNTYDGSTIDTWFNQTYLQTLDSNVQTAIGTTNIPATSPYNSGVIRLTKKIFGLSGTELGESQSYLNVEGSNLPISNILKISVTQWTRSVNNTTESIAVAIDNTGNITTSTLRVSRGYRPAFTLPTTFEASLAPTTGLYDVSDNLLLKLPGVQIETGSYVGTGTYGASNPNSLTFGFAPKFIVITTERTGSQIAWPLLFVYNNNVAYECGGGNSYYCTVTWGENEVTWYSDTNAGRQMNYSGRTHHYIAIG